jgi:hypothetical protein
MNGYKGNYMARRAFLMGIFMTNPNWMRRAPLGASGRRCNVGYAAKVLGEDTNSTIAAVEFVAGTLDLKEETIWRCVNLNDQAKDQETCNQAIHAYLLNKSLSRANAIIAAP